MAYEINRDLLERGMIEALKAKVNQLESALLGENKNINIKTAVEEYLQARLVARSFLVDTLIYDDFLLLRTKELKQRFGIDIR